MLKKFTYKKIILIIFLLGLVSTGSSFFLQYVIGLNPCPLCIFQRLAIISTTLIALLVLIIPVKKLWAKISGGFFIILSSVLGLGVAIRHIYIQNLPANEIPTCGPGLNFLIQNNTATEVISAVLSGSGECATVEPVLGLPIPIWSLIFFIIIILLTLTALFIKKN